MNNTSGSAAGARAWEKYHQAVARLPTSGPALFGPPHARGVESGPSARTGTSSVPAAQRRILAPVSQRKRTWKSWAASWITSPWPGSSSRPATVAGTKREREDDGQSNTNESKRRNLPLDQARASSRRATIGPWDGNVTVFVGPLSRPVTLSAEDLSRGNKYFRAELVKAFTERRQRNLSLPWVDLDVFRAYVYYISCKEVQTNPAARGDHQMIWLSRLWEFGDRIIDLRFKNAITDDFVASLRDINPKNAHDAVQVIQYLWQDDSYHQRRNVRGTLADIIMQWTMAIAPPDMAATLGEHRERVPRNYWIRSAIRYSSMANRPIPPQSQPRCVFHHHDEDAPDSDCRGMQAKVVQAPKGSQTWQAWTPLPGIRDLFSSQNSKPEPVEPGTFGGMPAAGVFAP